MTGSLPVLLEAASDGVLPRPGLTADVLRGGRRRRRHRAVLATAAVLAAVAVVPVGMRGARSLTRPDTTQVTFAGPLGDGTAHGDLADDHAYVRQAKAAWATWLGTASKSLYGHPVGGPTLVWAGTTPAGPAAILTENFDVPRGVGGIHAGTQGVAVFIGTSPTGPRVAASAFAVDGIPRVGAWYVDPAHRVLAVVDPGTPRGVSLRWTYNADGTARRDFDVPDYRDGVAVVALPDGVDRYTVQVAGLPFRGYRDITGIANVELGGEAPARGLRWVDTVHHQTLLLPLGNAESTVGPAASPRTVQTLEARIEQAMDAGTDAAWYTAFTPTWIVYGTTPDGRQVLVFERQLDNDPARLYSLVGGRLTDHGAVDPQGTLPVAVPLGVGQGWAVAARGATLRFRAASGPWHDTGRDAALLPAQAAQVEVTTGGRSNTVVLTPG
jgi:hypothetical protein